MNFKDSRLYELLQWVIAAGIAVGLLAGCLLSIERKVLNLDHDPDYLQLAETAHQLEEAKSALFRDTFKESFEQLSEEEKEALQELPGLEKVKAARRLLTPDYTQIDEMISIEKQLLEINEKENAIISSLQKKKDVAYFLLIALGFLFMLLSTFINHATARLLLAAISSMFTVGTIAWMMQLHIANALPYSWPTILITLLFAATAYGVWHFLSKKHAVVHRYICLQTFGAFSLAYALVALASIISEYFFPSELERVVTSYVLLLEKSEPVQKELKELLGHAQLNKEQKQHYIELYDKLHTVDEAWSDEILTIDIDEAMSSYFYQKLVPLSGLAVLYIVLGTFISTSLLISFGLILSGSLILLLGVLFLYFSSLSLVVSSVYSLFVLLILSYMSYHLYHQRRSI